jgi:sugar transferase (PEP-CTERM system associated)
VLLAAIDVAIAAGSYYIANVLLPERALDLVASSGWRLHLNAAVFTFVVVASQSAMGIYSAQQRFQIEGVLARMLVGIGVAVISLALLGFVFEIFTSRGEWLFAFGACTILLGFARITSRNALDDELFRRRVLVYGAGKRAAAILSLRRKSDQRGFRIVAFVPADSDAVTIDDDRVIHDLNISLLEFARRQRVTEIVVAVDDRRKHFRLDELLESKLSGIKVIDLLAFLERETGRVNVKLLNPSWLIFSEGFNPVRTTQIGFRLIDIVGAIVLFVLTMPLMAVIAAAIIGDDGRPVLYRQRRVGLHGEVFTLYKFRSMRKDAEGEGKAVWAEAEDSRVTRVGKWLRKTRLDELPQIINVLRGNMSFVGPRPERPEFVTELVRKIPYYHERHYVKPGITGWAQLRYPYGASEKDALAKLEYDLYYVKNRSLIFNLIVLLQTVEVVLWQKGSR